MNSRFVVAAQTSLSRCTAVLTPQKGFHVMMTNRTQHLLPNSTCKNVILQHFFVSILLINDLFVTLPRVIALCFWFDADAQYFFVSWKNGFGKRISIEVIRNQLVLWNVYMFVVFLLIERM